MTVLPACDDVCRECGLATISAAHGAVCPSCVFASNLTTAHEERVGPYSLLHELDAGATGTVYIAKHSERDGLVALKLAHRELLDNPEAVTAFRTGVRIQRALSSLPNIVATEDLGTDVSGRPYCVMPLLEGGTLADPENLARYATQPRAAIALVIELARAVQRAHQRGVLHCDLKPKNVLFDAEDEPFVGDFGLARIAGRSELMRGATFDGGTPGWMSPEQVQRRELTTPTDVFSLGVMLYWLLTGQLPFGDGEDFATRVMHQATPRLRAVYAGPLGWELEQICSRALQKLPEQRYRSAAELADDLARATDGAPIEAERRLPARRVRKWIVRHKIAALAIVEALLLLLYLPLMPLSVLGEVKNTIRAQIHLSAGAQAGAVKYELQQAGQRVIELARDPEIVHLVDHPDPYLPAPILEQRARGIFDGVSVFAATGRLRARWPQPVVLHPTLEFAFRDYYQGQLPIARARRREAYVARPYASTGDNEPGLSVSTPIYAGSEAVGLLIGRTRPRSKFGALQMHCGEGGACTTALLGPRDRDRPEQPLPQALFVLAAPGLQTGGASMVEGELAQRICRRLDCQPARGEQFAASARAEPIVIDDYEDPISHARSMAALAPVGRTGLIVVVATPNNALRALTETMADRMRRFLWVPVLLGFVLLSAVTFGPQLAAAGRRHLSRR